MNALGRLARRRRRRSAARSPARRRSARARRACRAASRCAPAPPRASSRGPRSSRAGSARRSSPSAPGRDAPLPRRAGPSIAWWPRCTPSKLPMVRAQLAASSGCRGWRKMRMGIDYRCPVFSRRRGFLGRREPAPRAGDKIVDADASEVGAVQGLDSVAGGRDHALDLVVLAFDQRQAKRARADRFAGRSAHGLVVVAQQHAAQQLLDLRRIDGMLAVHVVDLRRVPLRRGEAMDERAVVGEEQDAGRVFVEPADRLHAARAQRRGQQASRRSRDAWAFASTRSPDGLFRTRRARSPVGPRLAANDEARDLRHRPRRRGRREPRRRSAPARREPAHRSRAACRIPG